MGFDEGRLILDTNNGTYYAGQTIHGRIVFDQDKVKTIHGIYVSFKGYCKVHWKTHESRRVNNTTKTYTVDHDSYEEYVKNKYFIIGNSDGETHIQPGTHEFSFEFFIPENCPSTFDGSEGHIRYRVKAVMVTKGMLSMNKVQESAVRVVAPKDLNRDSYCKKPMEFEIHQTFCCWCVSSGASQLLVKIPVGGYCPGQVIPVDVSCTNDSNVEISEIKLAIKRDVKYIATSSPDTRTEHDTVVEIKKGPVPGNTSRNWTVEMDVPAMDIYNLESCRFIDINYYFKVSTEVSGCHEDEEETMPIIFGTIPLVGYQDNIQNPMHSQLPQVTYPSPPIVNQPLATSPYPNSTPYPNVNAPYPNTPNISVPYPTTPINQQYSPNNSPSPYPNQSYPAVNHPYPGNNSPYPGNNAPYPGNNAPYPGNSSVPPYPTEDTPNKAYLGNNPYPIGNNSNSVENVPIAAYPGNSPAPPYSSRGSSPVPPYPTTYPGVTSTTLLKTGTLGFTVQGRDSVTAPLLPPGANVPYPLSPVTPYASASAPEPGTPDSLDKKPSDGDSSTEFTSNYPAYNPEFMKSQQKGEN